MSGKVTNTNQPIINSNIQNFCSPEKFANCCITRINPDKNTFLKSNLIVSNILNHLSPSARLTSDAPSDAYQNRNDELQLIVNQKAKKREKTIKADNIAKCRSQTALHHLKEQDLELKRQVDKIKIMKLQMNDKARDIMNRKEDTGYLGRNLFLEGEKYLKQLKDVNPSGKTIKIEATRMFMKDKANKKGRTLVPEPIPDSFEDGDHANMSKGSNTLISNINQNEVSLETTIGRQDHHLQERQKQKLLKKLIKNRSFDCIIKEQKRHAAWEGFSQHWAMGFSEHADQMVIKRKRQVRRSPPKVKQLDVSHGDILDYNDKKSRYKALKKYQQTFAETAAAFSIVVRS